MERIGADQGQNGGMGHASTGANIGNGDKGKDDGMGCGSCGKGMGGTSNGNDGGTGDGSANTFNGGMGRTEHGGGGGGMACPQASGCGKGYGDFIMGPAGGRGDALQSASPGTPTIPVCPTIPVHPRPAESRPMTPPRRHMNGDIPGHDGRQSMQGCGMTGPATMGFGMTGGMMGCGYGDGMNGCMMMGDMGDAMGMDSGSGMMHDYGMKGCGMKGGATHGMCDDAAAGTMDGMLDFGGKGGTIGGEAHFPMMGGRMMPPHVFAAAVPKLSVRPFEHRVVRPPSGPPPQHLITQHHSERSSSSRTVAQHEMLSKHMPVPKFAVMPQEPRGWQPYPLVMQGYGQQ